MTKFVKVDSQYVRDTSTMAIINTDKAQYERIVEARKSQKNFSELHSQVEVLKSEFNEIKQLLMQIIGSNNG